MILLSAIFLFQKRPAAGGEARERASFSYHSNKNANNLEFLLCRKKGLQRFNIPLTAVWYQKIKKSRILKNVMKREE